MHNSPVMEHLTKIEKTNQNNEISLKKIKETVLVGAIGSTGYRFKLAWK